MTKITKEEVDLLINKGILVIDKGRYKELKTTGKSGNKSYYVPDYFLKMLKK